MKVGGQAKQMGNEMYDNRDCVIRKLYLIGWQVCLTSARWRNYGKVFNICLNLPQIFDIDQLMFIII